MSENITNENALSSTPDLTAFIPSHFRHIHTLQSNPADILEVFKFDRSQSELFLDCLQKGEKHFVEVSQDNRRLVHQLYFDAQNAIKTKGQNNLAVAYPFFYEKNEEESIFSPLFLFQINIEPELAAIETWRIESSRSKVFFNHYVFNYLKAKYGVDSEKIYANFLQHDNFQIFVKNTVEHIAEKVGFTIEYVANKIFPVQDKHGLENELNEEAIYFNAIVGNFEIPKEKITPFSFQNIDNQTFEAKNRFHYGLYRTDVAQYNALHRIQNRVTILTGHAGTGKTHTVTNFISFALSQGKKVLVINNNQRALLQVQAALSYWNLDKFSFVVKNPEADKAIMLDILRAIGDTIDNKDKSFNFKNFEVKSEALRLQREKLAAAYAHLQKDVPVAGNWQNLLGHSIQANAQKGKESLTPHINPKFFDFAGEEYFYLKEDLVEAKALYAPLQTLSHPLSVLHEQLFTQKNKEEALIEVRNQLNISQYDLLRLYNSGNQIVDTYKRQQRDNYQTHYLDLHRQITTLSEKIDENSQLLGSTYEKPGLWQRLFGRFSKSGKLANESLEATREAYDALAKTFASKRVLAFNFPKDKSIKPQKIKTLIKEFTPLLQKWNSSTEQRVQEEVLALNPNFAVNFTSEINQFNEEISIAIQQLNDADIFTEKFQYQGQTLAAHLKFIDALLNKLKTTEKDLAQFEAFHPFRHFWLKSDVKTHHLVESMVASKNEQWELLFDSWYFESLLEKNYANNLPQHTDSQEDILKKEQEVVSELRNQLIAIGQNRRYELLRQYRRKADPYNRIFGKNSQNLTAKMSDLLANDFDAATECFPVLLMSAMTATNLLTTQQFDYILWDDAQLIGLEQCGNLLQNAKQTVILGDPSEISAKTTSLLYWALDKQFDSAELSMIHTTKSNAMNLFLDAIYPSDSMRLPIVSDRTQFIDIVSVMGTYDEQKNTNSAEAEQVLTILNSIEKTALNRYPSVGIVTTTVAQRNLFSNILLQLKQKRSVGFDKILQLERNGMGVYHWSEIEGQKFDIVICSMTFGIKDTRGKLSEEIQIINTTEGFNFLYQTLTRASEKFYLCHSIPYSYFDEFYELHIAKGTFLLSALVKYCQALQNVDYQRQASILQKISEGLGSIKNQNQNFLTQEIFVALQNTLSDRIFTLMPQIGSVTIPIMIDKKESFAPNIALRIDGTFTLPYTPNPTWEKSFEEQLAQTDFKVVDTWSANWWRNKNGEVQRIQELLERIEAEHAPVPVPELPVIIEEPPTEEEVLETADANIEVIENQAVVTEIGEKSEVNISLPSELAEENSDDAPGQSERHHDNLSRPSEA